MEVLDAMQVVQRKSKTFSFFRGDKLIDVDRMNRLITRTIVIATTVAKGLPASGETGEKDISHDSHPQGVVPVPTADLCAESDTIGLRDSK
jgi:hypothetical protein